MSAKGDRTHVGGKPKPITEREVEVERRLNAGEGPTAIAREMGISVNAKPLITAVQMTQFLVIMGQSIYSILTGHRTWTAVIAWISTALMVQMIVLFGHFAMQAYCPRKAGAAAAAAAKDD